jgi:hypothetical protein
MLDAIPGFVAGHPIVSVAILLALVFDFVNGFHDSANAIATVIATKVLTPGQALIMAAVFNFIGPFVFGTAVAGAVGAGIIDLKAFSPASLPAVILAALIGAILWNLITWYVGLPRATRSSAVSWAPRSPPSAPPASSCPSGARSRPSASTRSSASSSASWRASSRGRCRAAPSRAGPSCR